MLLRKLKEATGNLNRCIEDIIRRSLFPNGFQAVLDVHLSRGFAPDINELLKESIVWMPTPKKRTTQEKKLTRKLSEWPTSSISKYAKVKTNIATCLKCGSYHEMNTICGKCYEKVKLETEEIKKTLNKTAEYKYNHPQKELAFVYENDTHKDKQDLKDKRVVEIQRKRPTWFNNNLFSKVISNKD